MTWTAIMVYIGITEFPWYQFTQSADYYHHEYISHFKLLNYSQIFFGIDIQDSEAFSDPVHVQTTLSRRDEVIVATLVILSPNYWTLVFQIRTVPGNCRRYCCFVSFTPPVSWAMVAVTNHPGQEFVSHYQVTAGWVLAQNRPQRIVTRRLGEQPSNI